MSVDVAIVGGLIGTVVAVLLMTIWDFARPSENNLQIVFLIGSAFTRNPIGQQFGGRVALFAVGICYGVFTCAVIYAFEVEAVGWIVGAVVSLALWVLTGITLTYFRLLHPRIRNGEIKAPGPFGLSYSKQSAVMLLIAHLVFGLVCGTVYSTAA